MEVAKRLDVAVVLVGHVTKEGSLAGPRALEHLVDCVLLFEGERERSYRTLRALKNRFGATSEVAVFEMRSGGFTEVADPSARFVGEATAAPGSCVLCAMEGTRPLLVEVQALVAPTEIVPPRRIANGIDRNRLSHGARRAGPPRRARWPAPTSSSTSRAASGSTSPAPTSRSRSRSPPPTAASRFATRTAPLACFGEVGLTGELRHVAHPERRVAEALKFGLGPVLGPPASEAIEGLDRATACRGAPIAPARREPRPRRARLASVPRTAPDHRPAQARLTSAYSDLSTRNSAQPHVCSGFLRS